MKNDCHYHPGEPAKWHCGECQIHYCSGCMPDADPKRQTGLCPHCGRNMRYLGAATEVEPFWQRLSSFFRYPLHSDPLLVVIFCTAIPMFFGGGMMSWYASTIVLLILVKYGLTALRQTANGQMKPPPVAQGFSGDGFSIAAQIYVVMVGLSYAGDQIASLIGPLPFLAISALALLVLPAFLMVTSMEDSALPALDPIRLTSVISSIGWPYFVFFGFLFLMFLAEIAAIQLAFTHFHPVIAFPLFGALANLFIIIAFHMLGYLLFQYQEELGFASDFQDEQEPADPNRDRTRRLDADIDMNLKDGNYKRVAGILEEALKRDPANPNRLSQLYQLSIARHDMEALTRHHPKLLRWMVAHRRHRDMKTLLTLLRQQDPQFQPHDPELTVACADLLFLQHEPKPALQLLKDFHKRFPDSDQIAPAYILVARILANGFEQWDKAVNFLNFASKHTSDPESRQAIAAYLEQAKKREPLKGPKATFAPATDATT